MKMLLLGNIEDFMRCNNHIILSFPKYIYVFFTKFIWALLWLSRLLADLTSEQFVWYLVWKKFCWDKFFSK